MIKPQDKVFTNLTQQLHRDLPLEPLTRLVNLAALAMGILRSKSLQVGQIITASPLIGSRDSLKNRVQRFLKSPDVRVEEYYSPLAQRLLTRLAAGDARVQLILDRTEWRAFNILYVYVGWRGRALPLRKRVYHALVVDYPARHGGSCRALLLDSLFERQGGYLNTGRDCDVPA